MVASSLVSYARAKADIYGLALPNGLMRRHERIGYLVAALLLGQLWPTTSWTGALPYPVTLAGVVLIAGVGLAAGLVLVRRTRAALAGRAAASRPEIHAPSAPRDADPRRLRAKATTTS
jgi:CDP-diacylglycerol--glycerol-3-phosphate 3-phosphatidyltransferase